MSDTGEDREPIPVTLVPRTWQQEIYDIVKKQGAFTVVLVIALYLMSSWVASKVQWAQDELPKHIKTINEGYMDVAKIHKETVQTILESAKDTMDRQERILLKQVNSNEKRVNALENAQN